MAKTLNKKLFQYVGVPTVFIELSATNDLTDSLNVLLSIQAVNRFHSYVDSTT